MSASFDPYHKWLGIPPAEQPPHHYRLIGVSLFESDPEVIDAACDQRMAFLQQCATGLHSALSQKLLNEIAAARVCLLDAEKKAAYDVELRERVARGNGEATAGPHGDSALRVPAAPRYRRTWLIWLGMHALVLYLGWTYLLGPWLQRERRVAPVPTVGAQPAVAPPTQPPPRQDDVESASLASGGEAAVPESTDLSAHEGALRLVDVDSNAGHEGQAVPSDAEQRAAQLDRDARTVPSLVVQLPPVVQLPALDDPAPRTLGTVTLIGERDVELALDSDMVRGSLGSFHTERSPGAARWTACWVAGTEAAEPTPVGDFMIHEQSLRFQWRPRADEAADQLRNCLLHVSVGSERHTLALRAAAAGPPLTLDLSKRLDRHVLEIPAAPKQRSLYLELLGWDNFPKETTLKDGLSVVQLGRQGITLSVDSQRGAEIQVSLDRYGSNGVAVRVSPTFKLAGNRVELTTTRLSNLRMQVDELPTSRRQLAALESRLADLRAQQSQLGPVRPRNPAETAAWLARSAEVQGDLGRTATAIHSLNRRIADLEQIQQQLPDLEKLVDELHKAATLHYRVFAKTGSDELELVKGDTHRPDG